jgi:hypothetical protein
MNDENTQAAESADQNESKAMSVAHKTGMNWIGAERHPDGLVPWEDAVAADMAAGKTTSRLRACGYCGSMHPADVVAAIKGGAKAHFADQKYGWPHKVYLDDVPNPHKGVMESRSSHSSPPQEEIAAGKWVKVPNGYSPSTGQPEFSWYAAPTPAGSKTWGKFYIVHLQDATPEDKAVIEQHLGVEFTFSKDGREVSWSAINRLSLPDAA